MPLLENITISKGIRYMLIAALGFSIMQGLIKFVSHVHVIQIVFFRSFITAIICTINLKKQKVSLIGNNQKLLFLRALLGLFSMTLFFFTIQTIPYGASVTLKYLSPFFTFLLAIWFLNEKVKPIQWLFLILALLGVILLKGFDSRIDNLSMLLAIMGAFFGACVYVIIRKIGKTEHPLVIVNYFMTSASIISGIALLFIWTTPTFSDFLILVCLGGFGYFGQKYMTLSFQHEEANIVAPFKYSELIYAFAIGFFFFNEGYSLLAIIGVAILLFSCVANALVGPKNFEKPIKI